MNNVDAEDGEEDVATAASRRSAADPGDRDRALESRSPARRGLARSVNRGRWWALPRRAVTGPPLAALWDFDDGAALWPMEGWDVGGRDW